MATCQPNTSATIAIGREPMNMNPAPTYYKLNIRPCISDGTVSCNTVVPIGTMLPAPTKNRMPQDAQNQGDQANRKRDNPKMRIWPSNNQLL